MIYNITGYNPVPNEYWVLEESYPGGRTLKVDLFVSGELLTEIKNDTGHEPNDLKWSEYEAWCRTLVGRKVVIKELLPLSAIGMGITMINEKERNK